MKAERKIKTMKTKTYENVSAKDVIKDLKTYHNAINTVTDTYTSSITFFNTDGSVLTLQDYEENTAVQIINTLYHNYIFKSVDFSINVLGNKMCCMINLWDGETK